jgi:hypothetical protein
MLGADHTRCLAPPVGFAPSKVRPDGMQLNRPEE